MFYDETITINNCEQNPELIFLLIKEGYKDVIDKILSKKSFDINITDKDGNTVLMKLLKKGYLDLVVKYMKDKRWDVNHQNIDGDTFGHILFSIKDSKIVEIVKLLMKNKTFSPNIRNNKGDTILDLSIKNKSIYETAKILENKKFDNIGPLSFKKLFDTYIRTNKYGRYTKLSNLDMILGYLGKRELSPCVKEIIKTIKENYDEVKEEFINNKTDKIDYIFKNALSLV